MANLNIGWWFLILLGGVALVTLFWNYISKIIKISSYLLIQFVLGFIILFVFNIFGQLINIYIPLNIITASVAGFLRIPGLVILLIIKIFIV